MIQKVRNIKKYRVLPVLMIFFLMITELSVHAEEMVSVRFPVKQTFHVKASTDPDEGGIFVYKLTAISADAPMPAGSTPEGYQFSLKKNQSMEIGAITYSQTGTYEYKLELVTGSEKKGYTYDKEVYFIMVYVKNTENGSLVSEVIAKNMAGDKVGSLDFDHAYQPLASDPGIMVDPPVKETVLGSPAGKGIEDTSAAKTGDTSNIVFWVVLLVMAAIGILVVVLGKRKAKTRH